MMQPPQPGGVVRADVPSYLAQAILVTLLCCLPFGIVAIVYAAQVSAKLSAGDTAGAVQASRSARTWCWWSFGIGLLALFGWLLLAVLGGIAGEMAR